MRQFKSNFMTKSLTLFVLFFMSLFAFHANAQKDILLYSTDFTDWGDMHYINVSGEKVTVSSSSSSQPNSDADFSATLAGGGFILGTKPGVSSTLSIGGEKGMIYFDGSDSGDEGAKTLKIKPLEFVSGAVVEIEFVPNSTSDRYFSLVGANQVSFDEIPSDVTRLDRLEVEGVAIGVQNGTLDTTPKNGNTIKLKANSKATALFRNSFYFPSTFTGVHQIVTEEGDGNTQMQDITITSLKVYTSAGTQPYVASTNYPKAPADGLVMSGSVGGAANSGVVLNAPILSMLWNSTNNVTVSLQGADASKFSIVGAATDGTLTIPNAQIKDIEKQIDLNFSPSVRAGLAFAELKIEAAGANPYIVSLTGITGGLSPQITTTSSPIVLWTSLIAPVSTQVNVSGISLTGDVTATISGGSGFFFKSSTGAEVTQSTISLFEASSGFDLDLFYLGANVVGEQTAELVLSSSGATDVKIPLTGVTKLQTPTLYKLDFSVDPAGSAYVDVDPAGPYYLKDSKVTVTVTPENNFKVKSWSDNLSLKATKRTLTVDGLYDNIIIRTEAGTQTVVEGASDLYAYAPTNITDTSFDISWSSVPGASSYDVTVYNEKGEVVYSSTESGLSATLTGLNAGTLYRFIVQTTLAASSYTTDKVGPYLTTGINLDGFKCGKDY